ncbi:MAG: tRNA (adenosine(37)-N6)-dimethylallyltransferase MiaA [Omnitrophica WOR_2 bacterium GWF2_43_52]|nr:MAG: tRNA (adenosine(37)-N6)-dimethylallyltransferase MiaA [Omnitrophica WOR_2 bacterium GWC2_44_8]OGX21114.1 MAG: tRNA (adenosine(37)-N6)-dimethylallyltransferase MiaA [Omnitrophica WOR_2 bacterium GWF2_43_52]OGX54733.1 MAG: tRNA (adenosine(37)-N6)-dimethylallyltransferase MiaA [Omnitrophica WOR_2 bacterium RIFOXYC2_FULL_43_9]HAH19948.1 tRNA (adenosine(37)-N6)-dimethylallyltransferase MiaA [Candidatus Omnitrophota bacterium]HBG62937.1 tRNA (adenosine(37)-N6)-dimethylallyltransferase MiaA [C
MAKPELRPVKQKPQIIFLVGPTAIGKSALAISLAKKISAEIISLDSMQIYKGLRIVSSQPDMAMQKSIPHHLLGFVSPGDKFDVATYRKLALQKIRQVHKRKKIPLFVGGTGLYMSVLIDGIFEEVKKDEALRKKLYQQEKKRGSGFLYNKLLAVDREAAAKIHPHDTRRIVRALEVYTLTGKPISELWRKRKGLSEKYEVRIFGLNKDRQELYNDINARVETMFKEGLVAEVRKAGKKKISLTCSQAIGLKEVRGYLEGGYDLAFAKELMKKNTRNYAKRQLTWFRKDTRILWLDVTKVRIEDAIINELVYAENTFS